MWIKDYFLLFTRTSVENCTSVDMTTFFFCSSLENWISADKMTFFVSHLILHGNLKIRGRDDLFLLFTGFCVKNWTSPVVFFSK